MSPKKLTRMQRGLGASAADLLRSGTATHPIRATIRTPPPEPELLDRPNRKKLRNSLSLLDAIPAPAFPAEPGERAVDPGYEDERHTRRESKTALRLDSLAILKERALIEARELRALVARPKIVPWTYARNESEWWRAIKNEWRPYTIGDRRGSRYFLTRFEAAQTSGVPDLLLLDQPSGTVAWIEMKFRKFPYNWPKAALNTGCSPAQAVWLWRWRRNGGRAGVLMGTSAGFWIWIPAHSAPEWPERLLAPNGWMTVPHVVGSGPVPEPAALWTLDADLASHGGTPKKPIIFERPLSYHTEVPWPSEAAMEMATE